MNTRVIKYKSTDLTFPFIVEGNRIYPNYQETDQSLEKWCSFYEILIPEGIDMRYDRERGIEFYGETITLSGVYMDKETGKLSLDLEGLETVIAQIPYKRFSFENTAIQNKNEEATNE